MENLTWRKATYSDSSGGSCVEVARNGAKIAVRDSKDPHGPKLHLDHNTFAALLAHAKK
ncbi:DUF397 domain-containing protein [Actinomadura sp. SCN-SB]|uniref:DUF397 domain-containing protein n=1 Tax=Actinomadura sp. SCN-SB TaxID=3373092 RepID=UPI0037519BB9